MNKILINKETFNYLLYMTWHYHSICKPLNYEGTVLEEERSISDRIRDMIKRSIKALNWIREQMILYTYQWLLLGMILMMSLIMGMPLKTILKMIEDRVLKAIPLT